MFMDGLIILPDLIRGMRILGLRGVNHEMRVNEYAPHPAPLYFNLMYAGEEEQKSGVSLR